MCANQHRTFCCYFFLSFISVRSIRLDQALRKTLKLLCLHFEVLEKINIVAAPAVRQLGVAGVSLSLSSVLRLSRRNVNEESGGRWAAQGGWGGGEEY